MGVLRPVGPSRPNPLPGFLGSRAARGQGSLGLLLGSSPTQPNPSPFPQFTPRESVWRGKCVDVSMDVCVSVGQTDVRLGWRSGLLMQCGDVESNPGPKYPCGRCTKEVGFGGFSVACVKCGVWFHAKCAGLAVSLVRKMRQDHEWVCDRCGGVPVDVSVTGGVVGEASESRSNSVVAVESEQSRNSETEVVVRVPEAHEAEAEEFEVRCMKCGLKRRRGLGGMSCGRCSGWVHKKCCGLNRWQRDRVSEWVCWNCNPDRSSEPGRVSAVAVDASIPASQDRERIHRTCSGCKGPLRRNCGIVCVSCSAGWHLKCAFACRGQADRVDRSNWRCNLCFAEAGRRAADRVPG